MKIGIYLCGCGTMISEKICAEDIREAIAGFPEQTCFSVVDFICSPEGRAAFVEELKRERPERVVVAACSPRDHESTFRRCLSEAGINPYLLQCVNIREQIAWVTASRTEATNKSISGLRAALYRVRLHKPLETTTLEVCPDVMVIGAGPAGLKAALTLAEAGRSVTLVERAPAIGGLPVLFEQTFPALECAACTLEPAMMELLHGEQAERIRLLTLAEVVGVKGYYGNFLVTVQERARHVSHSECIGCGECAAVCPAFRNDGRKAIDFAYDGALPNLPFLDEQDCLRFRGEPCQVCREACPVGSGVIDLDEEPQTLDLQVGGIVVAVGAALYDFSGRLATTAEICDAMQFQRLLSANGPSSGRIVTRDGRTPAAIAIVHCAGSLDSDHVSYCSGVCCRYALAFSHQILARLPDAKVIHYHRELVLPGKHGSALFDKLKQDERVKFIRYGKISELLITPAADMVVLCNALVPAEGSGRLAGILDAPLDKYGFFQELHGQMEACQSVIKGIYPVGSCREPMDIPSAVNEGLAAAAQLLAGLRPGCKLEIEPLRAEVEEARCSGCRLCLSVCPYRAIDFDDNSKKARVNRLLCQGCGTCVAACPAAAICGHGYSDEQLIAEIKGLLE